MKKQTIIPLEVPWRVTTGATFAEVVIPESSSTEISFLGNLLVDREGSLTEEDTLSVQVVSLRVTFINQVSIQVKPPYNELLVINYDKYDWSKIDKEFWPHGAIPPGRYTETQSRFLEQWLGSKNCPVPQAYYIEHSEWLPQFRDQFEVWHLDSAKFQHYLLIFRECSVEAIAEGIEWSIESYTETKLEA